MTVSDLPFAMEICPSCEKSTASHLFRTVDTKRLCLLCAQRAEDSVTSARALTEDHRVHGGLGWLWKHVAWVAFLAVGYTVIKHLIMHFLGAE